jgi:ATP-dependent Lon protease
MTGKKDKESNADKCDENKKMAGGTTTKKFNFRSKNKQPIHDKSKKKNGKGDDFSSSSEDECDDTEEFDSKEFNKFISKLFPSKYINQKVQEILDKEIEEYEDYECSSSEDSSQKTPKRSKKVEDDSSDSSDSSDSDSDEGDKDEESNDDEMYGRIYSKKGVFEVLVSPGIRDDTVDEDDYDEDEDSDYEEDDEAQAEAELSSKHNKTKHTKSSSSGKDDKSAENTEDDSESNSHDNPTESKKSSTYSDTDSILLTKFSEMAYSLKKEHKDSVLIDEFIEIGNTKRKELEKSKRKAEKKTKQRNIKEFSKLVKDKRRETDYSMFRKMELTEQKTLLEKMNAIKKYNDDDVPMRIALLNTDIPVKYKSVALRKMNTLEYMEPGTNEYYKLKQWVDTFMRIPFNKYSNLPLTINDGVEKCHEFMATAKQTLNSAVYGLDDAKIQIIQMVGQWITNPDAIGSAIAIKGPMGTGKTTLVKNGISKILGREFAFIALGGATDSSVLEGHSYTYEGSTWGKIVDILVQCKTMNPVIYFDELDKISNTPKGEEIASILTHLTDTTQNNEFHDKYFSEIELDLSRCLFIFSYNEEEKVNPILKDRMYRISTKGYTVKEKREIADGYLLPKIREELKFKSDEIIIDNDTMRYIIEKYTQEEDGVRNLKRCLETIYRKINLFKLMRPGENLFSKDLDFKVEFPVELTMDVIDKIISTDENYKAKFSMYM